jgi:hypothetical protein
MVAVGFSGFSPRLWADAESQQDSKTSAQGFAKQRSAANYLGWHGKISPQAWQACPKSCTMFRSLSAVFLHLVFRPTTAALFSAGLSHRFIGGTVSRLRSRVAPGTKEPSATLGDCGTPSNPNSKRERNNQLRTLTSKTAVLAPDRRLTPPSPPVHDALTPRPKGAKITQPRALPWETRPPHER